jgi:hypothetical protein
MKIVKVVVDYLPKNASTCPFVSDWYCDVDTDVYGLICMFKPNEKYYISINDFLTKRCVNCPLSTLPLLLDEVQE